MAEEILNVKSISKSFHLQKRGESLLGKIYGILERKKERKTLEVLKEISFNVKRGEIIGIVGRNGCGKSTLLRIIAGIYSSDFGETIAKKEPYYLSGWGQGIQARLTVKENIFLAGSILGLSQKNLKKKSKEILEFAGLTEFENVKAEHLSSGMMTRLSFSIGINCLEEIKPEILLLDEVFGSGGDIEFQHKALDRMERLVKSGITIILVTHSLDLAKKYCNRAIWIDRGIIKKEGEPEEVIKEYENEFRK